MLRGLGFGIVLFITSESSALDWNSCDHDLRSIRNKTNEAIESTLKLRKLYDGYETRKYELDNCINFGGDCQYLRLEVNAFLIDYKNEKTEFNNIMQSINQQMLSVKKTCGYEFHP